MEIEQNNNSVDEEIIIDDKFELKIPSLEEIVQGVATFNERRQKTLASSQDMKNLVEKYVGDSKETEVTKFLSDYFATKRTYQQYFKVCIFEYFCF